MTTSNDRRGSCEPAQRPSIDGHPLLLFPIFRRIPYSWQRDLVYTLIWNTLMAAVFLLLGIVFDPPASFASPGFQRFAWSLFVIANCIGYIIHFSFQIGDAAFPGMHRRGILARGAYYSALPIAGVFAGYWLATLLLNLDAMRLWVFSARGVLSVGALSLIISGILLAIFIPRERAAKAEAAFERERSRVAAAERETVLARMKLLEAQIEPHFLYNTLAHVMSLVDAEPAQAKRMIERLIALLRASAGVSAESATLGAQAGLLRAYLEILELRMGSRLAWTIDLPPDLAPLAVPPMLLQPVVENAIKHGLEPTIEGGRIDVVARRDGGAVLLTVADTGRGFAATRAAGTTGIGLPNLRARLQALYGDAARFSIEDNVPAGARVTIRIPLPPPALP